jgi:hypothetical protein
MLFSYIETTTVFNTNNNFLTKMQKEATPIELELPLSITNHL